MSFLPPLGGLSSAARKVLRLFYLAC
ncbi:hypothetical protein DVH24_000931 [Malus domestica]|uniref:Uncharacterized protein n=1 Tax=Malus domestica TaxID=3750 RepID=A0A498K007_MALDO|nr:hypothetical protein DVH24_000931 [Malus domestica]